MDDATSLVSELLQKLSELEQKVEHHRQDMATEFQRYSRQLLHDVSGDVSAQVEKAIKDSMHNYPALGSALDHENPIRTDSPKAQHIHDKDLAASNERRRRGRGSPPPLLPHTSGTPPDVAPRSPHEREREFQGLFTPSYLPLLDSTEKRHSRGDNLSPPTSPPALPLTEPQSGKLIQVPVKAEKASPPPILSKPVSHRRPDPIRRYTEDSYTSDESTSRSRRSALRRSSSSSTKTQSPRRVRFEVEGGEVLPTASPPMSPRLSEHPPSPLGAAANHLNASHDSSAAEEKEEQGGEADDMGLLGSSPPRPKKITSTDRLKALTRNSKEDTSKWTVVGDLQELDEDEDVLMMGSRTTKPPSASLQVEAAANADTPLRHKANTPVPFNTGLPLEDMEEKDEDEDQYEDDEDEGSLEMPQLTSFKGRKEFSPPQSVANSHDGSKSSESTVTTLGKGPQTTSKPIAISSEGHVEDEDEEELFEYESDEGESISKREKGNRESKPLKYIEEMDDEFGEESSGPWAGQQPANLSLYSTSPAISISKTAPAETTTTPSRYAASIGSYKGKPYVMPSVKNDEVYEKAAKMGDFESFVGSVHDRPGMDVSSSYRPDKPAFNGSPKSFSQRMMMEDFLEARKKASDTDAGK